jgi:hypothetical protein
MKHPVDDRVMKMINARKTFGLQAHRISIQLRLNIKGATNEL